MTEKLISIGAGIHCVGQFFHTLLQAPVASGDLELVLVFSGEVDVNSEGGKYGTALQTALARYILAKKFYHIVRKQMLPVINHLILKGAHVDARVGRIRDGTAFELFRWGVPPGS